MYLNQIALWNAHINDAVHDPYGDVQYAEDTKITWSNVPTGSNMSNPPKAMRRDRGGILGYKGFVLGKTKEVVTCPLDGDTKYWPILKSYPGYMSSTVCESLNVDETFVMNLSGAVPDYLQICFDSLINEYAIEFSISNNINSQVVSVVDNSHPCVKILLKDLYLPKDSTNIQLTMHITKWSRIGGIIRVSFVKNGILSFALREIRVRKQEHVQEVNLKDGTVKYSKHIVYTHELVNINDKIDDELVVDVYDMRTLYGQRKLRRVITI